MTNQNPQPTAITPWVQPNGTPSQVFLNYMQSLDALVRANLTYTVAPGELIGGTLKSANFNSTADQAIAISCPTGHYLISAIIISHPSVVLTTAQGGFYSATSKGGIILVAAAQAYSGLNNIIDNPGSALGATLTTSANTTMFNLATLYLSLTTAQGAAATADVTVLIRPLP